MYSKEQASQLKQTFWTVFGQYIAPHPSAEGLKINWVNYKTGIKYLRFKMHAGHYLAYIAIELLHPDLEIQEMIFMHFNTYKTLLESTVNETWDWQLHVPDENGKIISRIIKPLHGTSVFKKEDWPGLISFFKPRIIALDEFWSNAQYGFDLFK